MFVHAALPNTRFDAIKPVFAGATAPMFTISMSPAADAGFRMAHQNMSDSFERRNA